MFKRQVGRFISQKIQDWNNRHEAYGSTIYLQEPNLKESVGGLRDFHTAIWISTVQYGSKSIEDLQRKQLIPSTVYLPTISAVDFMLRVRNELHLLSKRCNDILKRLETNSDVDPTIVDIDKKRYLKMIKNDLSKVIAGRSIKEILDRFNNKIKDPRRTRSGKNVSKLIKDFLKIKCPIANAAEELNKFFRKNKINLVVDQRYFPISNNKVSKLNVIFSASFGRQLEYYTGMVFKIDIKLKKRILNIINGGRYDMLISDLGSKKKIPAVGAALNL